MPGFHHHGGDGALHARHIRARAAPQGLDGGPRLVGGGEARVDLDELAPHLSRWIHCDSQPVPRNHGTCKHGLKPAVQFLVVQFWPITAILNLFPEKMQVVLLAVSPALALAAGFTTLSIASAAGPVRPSSTLFWARRSEHVSRQPRLHPPCSPGRACRRWASPGSSPSLLRSARQWQVDHTPQGEKAQKLRLLQFFRELTITIPHRFGPTRPAACPAPWPPPPGRCRAD